MHELLNIFKDLPGFLDGFVADYGGWVYGLLFAIVFCETGLVVTPFLPGDSLLFAVGMLCGRGTMRLEIAAPLLFGAAIIGNTCNYWIGKATGPVIFRGESSSLLAKLLSRKHLDRAHAFYERHGGKAVIMGQFVPIVRTFVPYVAGAGAMNFSRFFTFNVLGALLWIGICMGAGRLLGGIAAVREHFELVVLAIIAVSLLPLVIQFVRSKLTPAAAKPAAEPRS